MRKQIINIFYKKIYSVMIILIKYNGKIKMLEFNWISRLKMKLLMKKEMRNIIFGMIKKFKMKSFLREKVPKLNAILSLILVPLKPISYKRNHTFVCILQRVIASAVKIAYFSTMFPHQKNAWKFQTRKIYSVEADFLLIEKIKWELEIIFKNQER